MKIAFVTVHYNPKDIRRGSGSYYCLAQEIERQGYKVEYFGPIDYGPPLLTRLQKKISTKFKKRFTSFQDIFAANRIGQIVSQQLDNIDYDFLLTNDYAVAGFTSTEKPIILYTDAIFPADYSRNTHPWLANLFPTNVLSYQLVNRKGLQNASLCCFPTDWAIEETKRYNTVSPDKLRMIPFGANIKAPPVSTALQRDFLRIRGKGKIDILFVGKDWDLKGGEIAVKVTRELRKRGENAVLHIAGLVPPFAVDDSFIEVYGLLHKDVSHSKEKLEELYQTCDFLLVPTVAEGFGIVFAEAAAYGLPSLAFASTGVTTSVKDGESGVLISLDEPRPELVFADIVSSWIANPFSYDRLVNLSRRYYDDCINWETATYKLIQEARGILARGANGFQTDEL